jgi:hypothetical protein
MMLTIGSDYLEYSSSENDVRYSTEEDEDFVLRKQKVWTFSL